MINGKFIIIKVINLMSTETKIPMTPLEKFQKVEHDFNEKYLVTLLQLTQIVEDHETKEDEIQHGLLLSAYHHWFDKLQSDTSCMDACEMYHDGIEHCHKEVLKRDISCFDKDGIDLFSSIFGQPGINSPYLYDQLTEGSDDEDENLDQKDKDDNNGKLQLWKILNGLTRFATLICIYLKMPIVKELIDLILVNNPDINQGNILNKIMSEFAGKGSSGGRMKKLIWKLLKQDESCFGDIFNSIQRVIATFSAGNPDGQATPNPLANLDFSKMSGMGMPADMQDKMDDLKKKNDSLFTSILSDCGVENLSSSNREKLLTALDEQKEMGFERLIADGIVTCDQMEEVRKEFETRGMEKLKSAKAVSNLGETMQKMMDAMRDGSEEDMKKLFSESSASFENIPGMEGFDMKSLQKEMENLDDDELEVSDVDIPDTVEIVVETPMEVTNDIPCAIEEVVTDDTIEIVVETPV